LWLVGGAGGLKERASLISSENMMPKGWASEVIKYSEGRKVGVSDN